MKRLTNAIISERQLQRTLLNLLGQTANEAKFIDKVRALVRIHTYRQTKPLTNGERRKRIGRMVTRLKVLIADMRALDRDPPVSEALHHAYEDVRRAKNGASLRARAALTDKELESIWKDFDTTVGFPAPWECMEKYYNFPITELSNALYMLKRVATRLRKLRPKPERNALRTLLLIKLANAYESSVGGKLPAVDRKPSHNDLFMKIAVHVLAAARFPKLSDPRDAVQIALARRNKGYGNGNIKHIRFMVQPSKLVLDALVSSRGDLPPRE